MKLVRFTSLLAILILVSSCSSNLGSPPHKKDHLEVHDFQIESIYGGEVSLGAYLGKKAVLMLFWTTWCPYCRSALIDLNGEREYLKSMGIELLAINIGESPQKVISFVERIGLDFTVLLDRNFKVADSYGLLGVPTYIIINKSGKVVFSGNRFSKTKLKELNLE